MPQHIERQNALRERLSFILGDGLDVITQHMHQADAIFFVDPPYTAGTGKRAGRRLYDYSELNHHQLFELMSHVQGDFLMTYDNNHDVKAMAKRHGFQTKTIAMKNTHHAKMTELLISRDLNWCL